MVFVRPGELRHAEWKDIDLELAEWRYTVTKTKTDHLVPLATQAVAILQELRLLTGSGRFVFPCARSNGRPMSDNAVLAAMRRSGRCLEKMGTRAAMLAKHGTLWAFRDWLKTQPEGPIVL